jgi:tetratricopeptide (TPR) repeat protein
MQAPPSSPPTRQEVLEQLEDIGASGKVTGQKLKILGFVTQMKLDGREDQIKELTIATDALGRSANFDGKIDPVVRVQVGKLRDQLAIYYDAVEKWRVRVKIDIPVGRYVPTFSYPDPAERFSAAAKAALQSAQLAADRLTLPSLQTALYHLNDILRAYPDHPYVLAMKADVHVLRAMHGLPPWVEMAEAERLAQRAVELAPELWQAQNAYGCVHAIFRRWDAAREAFSRAAKARLDDGPVHFFYGWFLASQGELEEAIRLTEKAVNSTKGYYGGAAPASAILRSDLAFMRILGGYLEEGAATLESAIADFPDFYVLPLYLAMLREARDDRAGAVKALRSAKLKRSESAATLGLRALYHGLAGGRLRARFELTKLMLLRKVHYVPASQIANALVGLGESRKAIRWLRQMADNREPFFIWLGCYPYLRHLAADSKHKDEFFSLLDELGLKWYWARKS